MTALAGPDGLETRLRAAYRVALPSAPQSLADRIDPERPIERERPAALASRRLGLGVFFVPVALAIVVIALAVASGRTPEPSTPTGSWAIDRIDAVPAPANVYDVWAVDVGLIAMTWRATSSVESTTLVLSENEGRSWRALDDPRPGFIAKNGIVTDGTLYLIGATGPPDDPTWWEVATSDGRTWQEVGELSGFPPSHADVTWMAHGILGWVASLSVQPPGEASRYELRASADGIHWETPALPGAAGEPFLGGIATDGQRFVVIRSFDDRGTTRTEALVSDDLRTWAAHPIVTADGSAGTVASDGLRFVAVGSLTDSSPSTVAAWTSRDGSAWTASDIATSHSRASSGLRLVLPTAAGFVAIGDEKGDAWLSADGLAWRQIAALPGDAQWDPFSAAVRSDTLVVGGRAGPDSAAAVWVTSLAAVGSH